jgi:hypothetical protein
MKNQPALNYLQDAMVSVMQALTQLSMPEKRARRKRKAGVKRMAAKRGVVKRSP